MTSHGFDSYVHLRTTTEMKTRFYEKAGEIGHPPDILRELVHAFVEDRLTIKPGKGKELLYGARDKN